MENIQELWSLIGSYALTGAILTSFVQVTKSWIKSRGGKVFYTFLIAIGVGSAVYLVGLLPGELVTTIAGVWTSANTVYLLFLKPNER